MRSSLIIGASIATVIAAGASADITGAVVHNYAVTAEDFGGTMVSVNVSDLYLASDDAADTALNVYKFEMVDTGMVNYFQSAVAPGWLPYSGGIFDTDALRRADSFVTIGGFSYMDPEQSPGAGASTEGRLTGWYNGNPPNFNGQVGETVVGLGVLIGRFSYDGEFSLVGSTLGVTWNQGLGTPGQQAGFTVVPAPGVLALLGLAGLAGRRRRNG